ncbi:hypothetical protein ACOQFO_06745, partial [Ureibacillus sp. MALMAid1270]|uniref:hypothetical protein n=1 Tax=Ureibacillus sp. MALMAid1270 TaxID=3411629 RepID=UPI003BA74AD7
AMAHNLLKVAGIRQLLSLKIKENRKQMNGKSKFPFICFLFRAFWTAPKPITKFEKMVFIEVMKTKTNHENQKSGLHRSDEDQNRSRKSEKWSSSK